MKSIITLVLSMFIITGSIAQCPYDNAFWTDLTPTGPGNTQTDVCVWAGDLITVGVVAGETYIFTTCNSLGGDSELTLYTSGGGTLITSNDDDCGLLSTITWTATFTGTVDLLIDEWDLFFNPCSSGSTCYELSVTWVNPNSPSLCSNMSPICTNAGLSFTAASTGIPAELGNNYGCLVTQPDPSWYYFEISAGGNIDMQLTAGSDIDYAIWGPYANLAAAQAACGTLPAPIDCSYDPAATEFPSITGAVIGEVYIMVITNYAGVTQSATLIQTGGTGATDCSIVTNCTADAGTVSVNMYNPNSNNYYLCFGDSLTATSNNDYVLPPSPDVPGLGYALYACPPTTGNPDTDPCFTGWYWSGQDFTEINDANSIYNFVLANPLGAPFATVSGNVLYWVPITMDDIAFIADGGADDNFGHDIDLDGCYDQGTPIQITYLNPITATEVLSCGPPSTSLTVTLSGGYPEFVPGGSYTVTNTGAGTISQSGAQGQTITITGISDGDVVSFSVTTDANGCTFNYTFTISCTGCNADAGTVSSFVNGIPVASGSPLVLCWGDCLDLQTDSNFVLPPDATPEVAELMYAIYNGIPDPLITDPDLDPNFSGYFWTGDDFQDCNDATSTLITSGLFPGQNFWFVPITMDDSDNGVDPNGTIGLDTDGDGCWALGTAIEIAFLDSITATVSDNCQTVVFTLNGGYPDYNATASYTVNNTGGVGTMTQSGASGEIITFTGYTPGQTLSFDVSNDGNSCFNSFTHTSSAPPSVSLDNIVDANCGSTNGAINVTTTPNYGPCTVTINMFDSYGDGWNGASLSATVNGAPVAGSPFGTTFGGFSDVASFTINPGDVVVFTYAPGTWEGEVTYNIVIGGTQVFNDGPNPTTGVVFSYTCPSLNYSWSNGGNTEDINGLGANTYTLTVSDNNGCSATAGPYTVNELSGVTATLNSLTDVACAGGNNGTVNIDVTGGTAPYSYNWSNGATAEDINGLGANTYTLTVTDNGGCSATVGATITEPSAISISVDSSINAACGSNNGSLFQTSVGGTGVLTYLWSNGATTEDISGLTANSYTITVTDANGCTASNSGNVSNTSVGNISFGITDPDCNGASTGCAQANYVSASGMVAYIWSNGQTDANICGLNAANYTVTVTDTIMPGGQVCVIINDTTLTEPSSIGINLDSFTDATCNISNGDISISSSGGTGTLAYLWSNGASTEDINGLDANTYSLTVTDGNGCTDSINVSINQLGAVSTTASVSSNYNGADISCNGSSDGELTASGSGGLMPYVYAWSDGQTSALATGLSSGIYTITITDANGCSDTFNLSLTDPTVIGVLIDTLINGSCNGSSDGYATVLGNGGTGSYSYNWSNGFTSSAASGLGVGNYTMTLTDANACSDTLTFSITEPNAIVALDTVQNINCNGDASGNILFYASGGTPGFSYVWSNGATTEDLNNVVAGSYSVTVTDANGCILNYGPMNITEPSALSFDNISTVDASCTGADGSVTLTVSGATGPYTYIWSNGASTQNLLNLTNGSYDVTVTDANGCTYSNSALVNASSPLDSSMVPLASEVDNLDCDSSATGVLTIVPSGAGTFTYLWSNGETSATAVGLSAGAYSVTISNADGCTVTQTGSVVAPFIPSIDPVFLPSNLIVENNEPDVSINIDGGNDESAQGVTYLWSGSSLELNFDNNTDHNTSVSASISGAYTILLTATSADGCTDTASIYLTLESPYVGIPDAFSPNGDGVNDTFGPVGLTPSEIITFKVFNRWSELIFDGSDADPATWDGTMNGVPQPQEVYIYLVEYSFGGEIMMLKGEFTLLR